ncbi:MAG: hypothetical protein ACI3W5_10470 [Faecousia sp.]
MKRLVSIILAVVLCLSLAACSGGTKLTEKEITDALADCKGTLNVEKEGSEVIGFTFVVEKVNAKDLVNKSYSRKAIEAVAAGDMQTVTIGQVKVSKAFAALMAIDTLLEKEEGDFNSNAFVEKILAIACDGKSQQYDGWTVSAKVDQESDSMTIYVKAK